MSTTTHHARPAGEQRLALAVLRQAFADAAESGGVGTQARGWLQAEPPVLRFWADIAGVSLREIRHRLDAGPPPPRDANEWTGDR